jgi:hypothetical protein
MTGKTRSCHLLGDVPAQPVASPLIPLIPKPGQTMGLGYGMSPAWASITWVTSDRSNDQPVVLTSSFTSRPPHGPDGDFQLAVVRLGWCFAGKPRGNEHSDQWRFSCRRPFQEFVRDAGNQGKQHDACPCFQIEWPQLGIMKIRRC